MVRRTRIAYDRITQRHVQMRKTFKEDIRMRYGIAWLLGVPVSVLVVWYLVTHLL
jgi:hypothetical protein